MYEDEVKREESFENGDCAGGGAAASFSASEGAQERCSSRCRDEMAPEDESIGGFGVGDTFLFGSDSSCTFTGLLLVKGDACVRISVGGGGGVLARNKELSGFDCIWALSSPVFSFCGVDEGVSRCRGSVLLEETALSGNVDVEDDDDGSCDCFKDCCCGPDGGHGREEA